jgi:hypothetical protein
MTWPSELTANQVEEIEMARDQEPATGHATVGCRAGGDPLGEIERLLAGLIESKDEFKARKRRGFSLNG